MARCLQRCMRGQRWTISISNFWTSDAEKGVKNVFEVVQNDQNDCKRIPSSSCCIEWSAFGEAFIPKRFCHNEDNDDDDDGRRIPFGNLAKTSPLGTRQGRSFFHLTTVPIIGIPKPPIVGNYNCKLFIVVNYNQRVFIRLANGIFSFTNLLVDTQWLMVSSVCAYHRVKSDDRY